MVSQTYNAIAIRRYAMFVDCINFATEQLGPLEALINRMKPGNALPGEWRVPKVDELRAQLSKARKDLEQLKAHAVKYEIELKSREWRV
ncbi:hypothetical protein SK854_30630 [Lentzea sp. BCCO 10_0061]|uniref:Uncharacterized protein n=1 Tax=Lentzea sokolovensis TaxID=3095429 RepID=A0ABU4V4U2_9PSEU|nr:hypothetical protein [Lentzea sp. BCCO 10_0061]MDX8146505.1 hypothetical protein [Lentzea sp. BCCO 10_0061]